MTRAPAGAGRPRVARRIQLAARAREAAAQAVLAPAADPMPLGAYLRGRIARKVRVHLRKMEPVVLLAPRWSQPLSFLEELALDLAVGQPALSCRIVSFRTLKGRRLPEIWNHIVDVFRQLANEEQAPTSVADRRGFRWALRQHVAHAHAHAPHRVALLAAGAEQLPLSVLEDLALIWEEYWQQHHERRCNLLLAGSVQAHWLRLGDAARIELVDYSEAEAVAAIAATAGEQRLQDMAAVARFTGGIPEIIDRVIDHLGSSRRLPTTRGELLQILGTLGDEMRGAVDIIAADVGLSARLERLLSGEPLPESRMLDEPLRMAGLLRVVPAPGRRKVALRAPAIAALVG